MRNFVPAAYSHCGGNGAAVRVFDGLRLPSLIWKIVSTGKAVTFQKDVADRFANKGFRVEPDGNNVNYIISL